MSDGDIFREVEEAVRSERYKQLWDKYGVYVLAFAVAIVVAVAGYKGWVYWRNQQAAKAGSQFTEGLAMQQAKKSDGAQKAFRDLQGDGPAGYEALSKFQLAAMAAKAGKTGEAVKMYDALASDGDIGSVLQGLARIKAATLELDHAGRDAVSKRLTRLADPGNPWRYSAHELLGLAAYRAGDMDAAKTQFNAILADPGAPDDIHQRAEMMMALVTEPEAAARKTSAKKTSGQKTSDKKTSAEKADARPAPEKTSKAE